MELKPIIDQVKHETKAVQGEETKDVIYASENTFPDDPAAAEAFTHSIAKLFDVNGWSALSLFTADFTLHNQAGQPKSDGSVQTGDYIRIDLPGPVPQNWVQVIHVDIQASWAEFTVQPSPDPQNRKPGEIAHFFSQEARSTFRVELSGRTIRAFEIGHDERINNDKSQAGERAAINTVVAEVGWLFYQKVQWKLLTNYLVDV